MAVQLTAGMRANLFSLQQTTKMMDLTQKRLSTGKKVNTALDDPVNFFKSKDHYDRATDLAAKKDGMSEGIKSIEAADTGIEAIYDLLAQMKSLASAAKTSDNTGDLQTQFNTVRSQIATLARDSKYGGNNLLNGDTISVEFDENGINTLSVGAASLRSTTAGSVAGASITSGDFSTQTSMESAISEIDSAVSNLRTEAQKLASNLSTISIREDFTEAMINTLNTGADRLVLADMNEEGANMLMLQTRQALGTTSLSLASQAAQSVLRLF
jgi:flagellin-like hook-associated protein FlgL